MCICGPSWQAESRAVTGPDWEIDGPTGIGKEPDLAALIELREDWSKSQVQHVSFVRLNVFL